VEVVGVIDTGFTGFVLLPAQYALSLNLKVQTTTTVTLADESQCVCLLAEASVSLDATTSRQGLVMLEKNCKEVLIGMDFLRQFGLGLALFSKSIALIDESKMEAALRTSSTPPTPPEEPKRNKR
jgi:predicted aspartyl protease